MSARRSPLFRAVVLAGASLTETGCGKEDLRSPANAADAATPAPLVDAPPSVIEPPLAVDAGTCPPGSERPVPPCVWIR
jgi:hypothetical protein